MDLNSHFFFVKDNQPVGPFSLDELLEKDISKNTYIWTKGMSNWKKIESIPVILERINNNKNQHPVFIEPISEGNNVIQKGKGVNKIILFAFFGIIVLGLGFIGFRLIKDDSIVTVNETLENSGENDLKKENLKGEVIYTKYISPLSNFEMHYEYNSRGFLTKQITRHDEIQEFSFTFENFFEDEKLIRSISTFGNPSYTKYIYDVEGKVLKETTVDADDKSIIRTIDYIYKDRLLIEKRSTSDLWTSISKYYYTSNNLDSIVEQNKNLEDKTIEFKYTCFNEKGQEIKSVNENGSYIITMEYNEFNEVKKEVINDAGDIEVNLYTYSYDENGNWIEKYVNGELESSRRIYYKGDDLTMVKIELLNKMESGYSKSDNSDSENQNNQIQSNNNSSVYPENKSAENSQSNKPKCYQCNGTGKCRECSKIFRKNYYKGNGAYGDRNETKPGYVMHDQCFGRGHIDVKRVEGGWEPGLDCSYSGCMDGWIFCRTCNYNGNGKSLGQCDKCKGSGFY